MRNKILICLLWAAPLLAEDRLLPWMDRFAQQQLAAREAAVASIHTVSDAESRKTEVREKILRLIGGLPDYAGPLNARVTGRIERPKYVIEKVVFESLPQVFVTANLYRPRAAGRYPGVLMPLGHWEEGKPAVQQIAANLALKGFVALAYDPLGQGERQQAYDRRRENSLAGGSTDQHILAGAQSILAGESFARYRIWDAKRALDYLVSRPEVDAEKIGATGCSGGGTLTTYISALDARIKVAAPACYMNTFALLFSGPTGDSEQNIPGFLASGLDIADYVELFAPKPWLMVSTVGDFFPIDGARRAYAEASRWYRVYGAQEKVRWFIGGGGHGTPLEAREAIYEWMIRWLKDGKGDAAEEPVDMATNFDLRATEAGQVEGRDIFEVIRESFRRKQGEGNPQQMLAELRKWCQLPEAKGLSVRVLDEKVTPDFRTQQIAIETEPGLELAATLYLPNTRGRKPAVLLVSGTPSQGARMALRGRVALALEPRGLPLESPSGRLIGDWITNTRALLIGRSLAGMRAGDIIRGVDVLVARGDVNAASVRAAASGVSGIWLLMAGALDPRIGGIWLDRTPYRLRTALDNPLHRDLHDALIPGFALRWDLDDVMKTVAPRSVIWTDPADWMGAVVPNLPGFAYRTFGEPDDHFLEGLLR